VTIAEIIEWRDALMTRLNRGVFNSKEWLDFITQSRHVAPAISANMENRLNHYIGKE